MWNMDEGWGWWMASGWLWMVIFWGLIIWAVVTLTRPRGDRGGDRPAAREPTALEILERRYAGGELSEEQFEAMRRRLQGPADT